MNKPIPAEAIAIVTDQSSFLKFLSEQLGWKIEEGYPIADLTYEWLTEDLGLKPDDLRGSTITQLRPFTNDQPWGIFFLHLNSPRIYLTELRKIIRAFAPKRRKLQDHPTWNPPHLLFICTPDWKSFTFAHFEGEKPQNAKIATFGWEYQSHFVRTLCEFNIPKLRFPEDQDMFGHDPKAWIDTWSSAFDVKPVTDKFYREYDAIFKSMKRYLARQFGISPKLWDKEYDSRTEKERKADERLHLFVQNLVNRLMFLKFLEKRRWLDFNPIYLSDLYNKALSQGENLYKKYLFYVFFAGLNRQVELLVHKQGTVTTKAQLFQQEIGILPFLNGGLFEKEPIDEEIDIPNEAFRDLFDLFGRYNFTVNEDTPLDVEVAVNPEMLGKVFEESVIARKEKGAYYTPRNIVSFMCREALKNHLQCQCKIQDAASKIEKLVDEHSPEELQAVDAIEIYRALHNIKVLDPAVGSGAFPVVMMLELVEVYKTIGERLEHDHPYLLQNKLANPKDVYNLKKQIIQNSLYGVDIEEFAINIARLRFWLSLAVDFPIDFSTREEFIQRVHEIEPLPNLLYKLRCGDSLLAHYRGVSLEPHGRLASGEYGRGRGNRIKDAIGDVARMKREFYSQGDSLKKQEEQRQIDSSLRGLVVKEIDLEIAAMERELGQEGFFELTKKERAERAQIEKEIQRLRSVRDQLSRMDGLPSDFPVIWDVEFGEVMTEGGFDVIIANPPYVRQEEIKHLKEDLKLHYECYTGTSDLYVYFYERGIKLLKPGGTLSYISSNKFFRAGYGQKLREYLAENTSITTLIDFGDLPVFEATTYPTVLIATKNPNGMLEESVVKARTVASEEELKHFEETFRKEAIEVQQSDLQSGGWKIEDRSVLRLLEKIKKSGVTLEGYVDGRIYRGIITGFNEAFVIDDETRGQLIKEDRKSEKFTKPFLRGRDIKRYVIDSPNLYLIYIPYQWTNEDRGKLEAEKFLKKELPAIYRHLKEYQTQLKNRDDQGDYWWEMRPCKFLAEFEQRKIVYPNILKRPEFAFDEDGFYTNQKCFIIPLDDKYLLGLLNSSFTNFLFAQLLPKLQGGFFEPNYLYFKNFPIARSGTRRRAAVNTIVETILAAKKKNPAKQTAGKPNADTSHLEREIDEIVYEIYGLTEEEKRIVGKS